MSHGRQWLFPEIAYADMFDLIKRFNTDDTSDLFGVYDRLIGNGTCDPFGDSTEAVTSFQKADWEPLNALQTTETTYVLSALSS